MISFKKSKYYILAGILLLGSLPFIYSADKASANNYSARIKALENEISKYDSEAAKLSSQADTLQREVSRLNNEKAAIQAKVNISQEKVNQLNEEIKANEKKIADSRDLLGDTIADLYVNDKVSLVETLFSSKGVGDYINKQEYRSSVRDQLTTTIDEIKRIKAELESQKKKAQDILADQENQRNQLASKEQEQATLLRNTRGDEAAYKKLSSEAGKRKEELQRQQQAAIEAALRAAGGGGSAVAGDPNKGGYPAYLANSNYYSPIVDPWGMYSRQCVSYTAWKVYQKNGHMPYWGGRGNANQWPANARAAGIPVNQTPRAGSVGVIMAGQYGHVVWVESVNSDGTINISQYNYWNAGGSGWGHYSEMYSVSPAAYDYYIHF